MQSVIDSIKTERRAARRDSANADVAFEAMPGEHGAWPRVLSDTQEALMERTGYLAIHRLASLTDVAAIRGDLQGVLGEMAGATEDCLDPHLRAPTLLQTRFYRNTLSVARALLGPNARFIRDRVVIRPARCREATPWRQDEAYADPPSEILELSFALALNDVDDSTGCMRFIPGSHRNGLLPHARLSAAKQTIVLDCSASVESGRAVSAAMAAGGCTLHAPRTIAATAPNLSDVPRWLYVVVFGLPNAPEAAAAEGPAPVGRGWRRVFGKVPALRKRVR